MKTDGEQASPTEHAIQQLTTRLEHATQKTTTRLSRLWHVWRKRLLVIPILVALGILGLGLENFAPTEAQWFWILALPLFGAIAIRISTWRGRKAGQSLWQAIRLQVYHWIGFLLALKLMFILIHSGQLNRNSGGLVSLLLLALTSYYAGVYFERVFLLLSALLAVAVALAAYIEEYFWIVNAILGLVVVILLGAHRFSTRRQKSAGEELSSHASPS